jgi:hypothetical protein
MNRFNRRAIRCMPPILEIVAVLSLCISLVLWMVKPSQMSLAGTLTAVAGFLTVVVAIKTVLSPVKVLLKFLTVLLLGFISIALLTQGLRMIVNQHF